MKKVITTLLILVVVIGGIAYKLSSNKKKNKEKTDFIAMGNGAIAVNVAEVKKQALDLDFSVNGNFAAFQELNLAAENSGRISRILVSEGSRVSKGQVLATIDANILNADKEILEAAYQNAQKDLARYESAYKTGGITQQQLDQARLQADNAKLRLQQQNKRSNDANIRSSINGVVNKKLIEVGAVVSPGTALFELVDISRLKLKVNVSESQVAQLKIGDKVSIKASVFPDESFSGKVSFIASKSDGSLNFPIEIEVNNNTKAALKAGMYGTAIFEFAKQSPIIFVPRSSFAGSVSSNQVYVYDKANNKAQLRNVVSGRILGNNVEILDGLKEGETIITSGQINLVDGSPVSIVK